MAVPKGKVSKERKHLRNSANFKSTAPTIVECPECHEQKLPHCACKKCGAYNGRKVVDTQKKETKK
ncbi:MAG: 50S ribosomal protein L32 [Clostridia bacterium]